MDISFNALNGDLYRQARRTKTPLLGIFELTGRCNLSCLMCYVRRSPGDKAALSSELSAEEWLELGRQIAEEGLLYLTLTGGEPLLRPDFFEIYEGLRELGLQVSVNTNATMVTPEIAKRFAASPPTSVNVTLYGASPETYDRACGDPTGFERTLRGIRLLREAGVSVTMRTTLIRQNHSDFEQIYALSRELGLKLRLVDYVFPGRELSEGDPFAVRLSPAEQDAYNGKFEKMQIEDGQQSGKSGAGKPEGWGDPFPCAAGNFSFVINYSGRLCACLMLDEPSFPLNEGAGFAEQWKQIVEVCAKAPLCRECRECDVSDYCAECPAIRMSEGGGFDKSVPYLCEMARLAAARAAAPATP